MCQTNTQQCGEGAARGKTPFERVLDARLVLSIIATGIMSFSGVVVETAMNVTFPTLMREFSVTTSTVQWITTAYLLVLAAVVPTSSYLGKRFRTKSIFATAMVFYIAGIVCGFTAQTFPMLIVGRILEGVGTGIALPLMFNIITEQAPERNIGVMMGIGTLVTALAPAIGPSVGGWLAETFGWRAIFAALLPLLAIAFALGIGSIRQSHPLERRGFDIPGWLMLVGAFAALILGVHEAGVAGVTPSTAGLLAVFVGLIIGFVLWERRVSAPLIDLQVFRVARFDLCLLSLIALQFTVLGLSFLLPNYAQIVAGAGETEAGSILLPGCVLGAFLAPVSGRLLDRFGAARPILLGSVAVVVALVLFEVLSAYLETGVAMGVYAIFTFGQGLMTGNTMTTGLGLLAPERKADGNAIITTLQQLSGAMGTSIVTMVVNAAQASSCDLAAATLVGTREAYLLLCVVVLIPLISMSGVFLLHRSARRKA